MPKRLTYEYVKTYIESFGYKLLSKKYINKYTKLKIQCEKGHIYKTTWRVFRRGSKCPECYKLKYEDIKTYIESFKYKLLSDTYKNSHTHLTIQCDEGHTYTVSWNRFQQGRRCPQCAINRRSGKNSSCWKGGVYKLNIALFDTYAPQIDFCEKVRRDPKYRNLLQVKCTNSDCKKWFTPTMQSVHNRVSALNLTKKGEGRFYCSDECKNSCVLYNQQLYPKGLKPYTEPRFDQKDWADIVKERDNYECQICGSTEKIKAHHFEGIYQNPVMSADLDMGITLCNKCEKKVHSEKDCTYYAMRRNKCSN